MALRLADKRAPGLSDVLFRLLLRSELEGNRGTLIYALSLIGALPEHVGLLCEFVLKGNWEEAHEALHALGGIGSAEGPKINAAAKRLQTALEAGGLDEWRRELVVDLEQAFR